MVRINTLIDTEKTGLVIFYATWCPHCQRMMPIWDDIEARENTWLSTIRFDIDLPENNTLIDFYKVHSVPTMLIFKSGEQVWRASGEITEEELLARLLHYR